MDKKKAGRRLLKRSTERTALAERPGRKSGEVLTRHVEIRKADINEDTRRVRVSFSSETDEIRFGGIPQILLHEEKSVDLSRLRSMGSVLFNHNPDRIVGHPVDVELDTKARKARATIVFDSDPESDAVFQKVLSGSLRGVSVGFKVDKWAAINPETTFKTKEGREIKGPAYVATRWAPVEFSLTPVPADGNVGVGRLQKEGIMPRKKPTVIVEEDQEDLEDTQEETENPRSDAELERQRSAEILELCSIYEETAPLAAELIRGGKSVSQARKAVMEELKRLHPPLPPSNSRMEIGSTPSERFAADAELSLRVRAGHKLTDKERERSGQIQHHGSLLELARESLRIVRVPTAGLLPADLVTRAMTHSTSDFPKILENVANKALIAGWTEAPATWRPLVRISTASDFKLMSRPKLGDSGDLQLTPELTPMAEGSIPETGESYSIATYAKRFGISRQAIINDDLSAFDTIPSLMGAAARRLVAKLFYDLLTSAAGVGPTMAEDGAALFATAHTSGANYTAGVLVLDVAGLGTAQKLMRLQKGFVAAGEVAPTLNLQPAFLLVPAALEVAAKQAVAQITPALVSSVNPFAGQLQVITEARLDAGTNGTTAWYLIASPGQFAGAEVAFLNGQETPNMVRQEGSNILGIEWGVFLDVGVKFVEHRSWYRAKNA